MTGIERSDWNSFEAGWVPCENERLLCSLSGTLQIRCDVLPNAIVPMEVHFADTAA